MTTMTMFVPSLIKYTKILRTSMLLQGTKGARWFHDEEHHPVTSVMEK
jgi:hypothetical protein